jgi:hypothetical protein
MQEVEQVVQVRAVAVEFKLAVAVESTDGQTGQEKNRLVSQKHMAV